MIDPVEALRKTSRLGVIPTATVTPTPTSVAPIPTVLPDPPVFQVVHSTGKRTLWVVFVLMLLSSAAFAGLSWRVPVSRRLYHVTTTLISVIAALSYFAMASGHGISIHETIVRHQHGDLPDTFTDVLRQVFWARYVDWSLTTPLLLLNLGLLAGLSGAHLLMAVVANVIMILSGLFAAFGSDGTPQKWGWFAIACIAYLVVIWHLGVNGRAQARSKGQQVSSFFASIAGFTIVVWAAYPVIWAIAGLSRRLSVDGEIIAYAVLDILAKPVFGIWLLLTHANTPETNVDLGGFWSYGVGGEGSVRLGDDGA